MLSHLATLSMCAMVLFACTKETDNSTSETPPAREATAVPSTATRCSGREACEAACKPCEAGKCDPAAASACRELAIIRTTGQPPQFDIAAAARLYELACERGDLRGCAAAGNHFQDGRGVTRDIDKAIALYDRACKGGVGVGCFNLGMVYEGSVGVDRDAKRAAELYGLAAKHYAAECDTGRDLSWCPNYGILYEGGYGVGRDNQRAAQIYEAACDKGNGDSCVNAILLDLQAPDRPKPSSVQPVLAKLQTVCDEGSRLACGVLGSLLLKNKHGVPRDVPRAMKLLERSCMDGHRDACFDLGAAHMLGLDGGASNPLKAIELTRRSCELGKSASCLMVAKMALERAPGTTPADERAYFQKACDIGNGEACGYLGAIYTLGRGVEKDAERGLAYTKDSCRFGEPSACVALIDRGIALPLPPERARFMYEGACRSGVAAACKRANQRGDAR